MKKYVFFVLSMLLSMVSYSQTSKLFDLPMSQDKPQSTIVRSISTMEMITCYNDAQGCCFTYGDINTASSSLSNLIRDLRVYDFRVLNDIVVYCGRNEVDSCGEIGWFRWPNLQYGLPFSVTRHSITDASHLYRLCTYIDDLGNYHAVAIGVDIGTVSGAMSGYQINRVFDFPDITASTISYEYCNSYYSATEKEAFSDVCYTGQYVVLLGTYIDNSGAAIAKGLTIRSCTPLTPLLGSIYDQYKYAESDDFVEYPELVIEPMSEEMVAVAYRGYLSGGVTTYTRLRVFSADGAQNVNSQEWFPMGKTFLYGMAYIPLDKSIVLSEYAPIPPGYGTAFRYLEPYNTAGGYTAEYLYREKWLYQSITAMSPMNFVGVGVRKGSANAILHYLFRDKSAALPAWSSTPSVVYCPESSTFKVQKIANLNSVRVRTTLPRRNSIPRNWTDTVMIGPIVINLECVSY